MNSKSSITFSLQKDLDHRKPIWIALSDLYLDTELQDFGHDSIARTILESPYSLEEVKHIDKYEVFPVLKYNLRSMTGVWTGFKEDWLIDRITKSIGKRKFYTDSLTDISYYFFKSMIKEDWAKISLAYLKLKT